eukprot:g63806.t1
MRRLGRQRGRTGFGNARAVNAFFDTVRARQADRIAKARTKDINIFRFSREDVLGPKVSESAIKRTEAYRELQALGLQPDKDSVDDLITLVCNNAAREEQELPLLDVVLNRVFLGNPWYR